MSAPVPPQKGKGKSGPTPESKAPPPNAPENKPADPRLPSPPDKPARLFRDFDWISFGVTTLLSFLAYYWTLAPDVTLEDSGELAVASFYAGVPHPPGYPLWTLYTWLFTVLVPFSNIAWRVALSSAVAAAFSCGLLALMVSRGSSMLLESIPELRNINRKIENWLCMAAGFVGGTLFAFNGFMWSQAVIVEVYTPSVLSFMAVLVFLMRWIYRPEQRRYLYWAWFLFGICFTNHQTLIVATMGIQVLIMAVEPRLGRDWFFVNSLFYLIGLVLKAKGVITTFDNNTPLFIVYNIVGVGSLIACGWLTMATQKLLTQWKSVLIMSLTAVAGASLYFYMPLASMTNPPLNWGYPRTVEGFIHALTRGQYDKTNPTDSIGRYVDQVYRHVLEGAVDEFNLLYILIGLLPFVFFARMQKRERAWLLGLAAIYVLLAFLLLYLLNPNTDKQSREQAKVFFTASHILIAMGIGYGITLICGFVTMQYDRARWWLLMGGAVAGGIELFNVVSTFEETLFPLRRLSAVLGLALVVAFTGATLMCRTRGPVWLIIVLFAIAPVRSVLSNWASNEQRGHLFGYWFGHDMFTPPFDVYPEMAKNAILFGGTDPGRFNPTYMIFCESFIPPECKPRDPKFDRRDVYLITQNALADKTYLDYIRAHYNRSTQNDPYFFSELVRSQRERDLGRTNVIAKLLLPVDRYFTRLGERIEKRRRERGVYPPQEINTPSPEDSSTAFGDYIQDASRRAAHDQQYPNEPRQLKPGEDVRIDQTSGRVSVSGQVAVMSINGLLTKVIFDKNPTNEFYVEESFPLDWMFPYLTPFGIIMKINRQPVPEITEEMVRQDHEFWSKYSDRMIGNWITYDTPVKEICDFAIRVYQHYDFTGFKGDRKFVRDKNAQKAFSKLRSAIGGVYSWRLSNSVKTAEEQRRMLNEAEFAFKQAFAFCPFSPEASYKYALLLLSLNRLDEALLIAETSRAFDPDNGVFVSMAEQIKMMKNQQVRVAPMPATQAPVALERPELPAPTNSQHAIAMAGNYLNSQQTGLALQTLDTLLVGQGADAASLLAAAQIAAQAGDRLRLTQIVQKLRSVIPTLEQQIGADTNNVALAFQLVSIYIITQQSNEAVALLDKLMANPKADASTLYSAAQAFAQLMNTPKLEVAMRRLIELMPTNAEAWYDLGAIQVALSKTNEALGSLAKAIELSDERLKTQPNAKDLRGVATSDSKLVPLHGLPEFRKLTAPK